MFCIILWPRQELRHLTGVRIMQGIGESMFPIAFSIMRDKFEPEKLAAEERIFRLPDHYLDCLGPDIFGILRIS